VHEDAVREAFFRLRGFDVLASEGAWFPTPEFLEENNIPYLHGEYIIHLVTYCFKIKTSVFIIVEIGDIDPTL
jgi:hypothetical protein